MPTKTKVVVESMKKLLAVAESAAKGTDGRLRPVLSSIHFKDDYMECTNGFTLIRVKRDSTVIEEMTVPLDKVISIRSNMSQNNYPVVIPRDGEAEAQFKSKEVPLIKTQFPETTKIMPKVDEMNYAMVDIKYLEMVVRAAKKLNLKYFNVRVGDNRLSPIQIDSEKGEMTAIIMPMNR